MCMHSISEDTPTTINIKQLKLSDGSLVYSVLLRQASDGGDVDARSDNVVTFDATSYHDAMTLAVKFANALAEHTNERPPINDWTA